MVYYLICKSDNPEALFTQFFSDSTPVVRVKRFKS